MRLRGQYTAVIGGLVCVSLMVLGAALLAEQRRYANEVGAVAAQNLEGSLERQIERHGMALATSLANRLIAPLYHRDDRLITHEAEEQRAYPDVLSIVVVSGDGKVISAGENDHSSPKSLLNVPWIRGALASGEPAKNRDGDRVRVVAPAMAGGHVLGAVVLEMAMGGIRGDIRTEQARLDRLIQSQSTSFTLTGLSVGIVLLTLSVLAAVGVAGGLARPVAAFAARARRIGSGELMRSFEAPGDNELGDLSRAFDDMAVALAQTTVSKDYFDNVLRSMADMLLVVDQRRCVVTANPSCLEELGCDEESLRGLTLNTLLPDLPTSGWPEESSEQRKSMLLHRPDGGTLPVRIASAPLRHGAGVPDGRVLVMQNISDRLAAEYQIERSLVEKETLLREIHHRVKNNLQIISSMLGLQGDRARDQETRDVFRESGSRIRAMAIVHEQLYRSEDLAHVNLATYLDALAQQIVRYSGRPDCQVEVRIDDAMRDVSVDRAIPIGLIVNELVANAVQHGFVGTNSGSIQIHLGPEAAGSVLSVADDGAGIPEGFDLKSCDSLGLKLVIALSEQIGGRFAMHRDHGTRCTITMPAALPARKSSREDAVSAESRKALSGRATDAVQA